MPAASPTINAGSRARASAGSPAQAARRSARMRPAIRCTVSGGAMTCGSPVPEGRSTAASRPPWPGRGGVRRAGSRSRVDGSRESQRCGASTTATTSTGLLISVTPPSGAVTRVASAVTTTGRGAPSARGRASRGSAVRVISTVVWARRSASSASGPAPTAAVCRPATTPPAAAHSRASAVQTRRPREARTGRRVRATPRRTQAVRQQQPAPAATRRPSAPRARAAAAHVARAGGTSRRSGGASSRGWEAPRRWPEAVCTAARGPAAVDPGGGCAAARVTRPARAGGVVTGRPGSRVRRTCCHRCRRRPAADRRCGTRPAPSGGPRSSGPARARSPAGCPTPRPSPC